MTWSVTWRPGEGDLVLESELDRPVIVVRPRAVVHGLDEARALAELVAANLSAFDRALEQLAADGDE